MGSSLPPVLAPTTVFPVLGNAALAASNTALLQNAVNGRGVVFFKGNGVASINAPLVIGSHTRLIIDSTLTIQQAPGINGNVLTNYAYTQMAQACAVTWTSGITASVNLANHGFSVGDFAFLSGTAGTTDSSFSGVFPVVSVTDANDFVVNLRRMPSAAPTGAITCKRADVNIAIEGGTWDYNSANNTAAGSPATCCLILSGISGLKTRTLRGKSQPKYFMNTGAVCNFEYFDTSIAGGTSDIIKVYGPAWDGCVDGVHGESGDDMCSLQGQDFAPYNVYGVSGWGDILDIDVINVDAVTLANGSGCAFYSSPNQVMDNVVARRITASCVNSPVINVAGASNSGSGNIGRVKVEDCSLRADNGNTLVGVSGTPTVDILEITGATGPENPVVTGSKIFYMLTGTIDTLAVSGMNWLRMSNGVPIDIGGGLVRKLSLEKSYFFGNGSGYPIYYGGGGINKIVVANNHMQSVAEVVNVADASAGALDVTFSGNYLKTCNSAIATVASVNVKFSGNTMDGNPSSGLVYGNGAITINVTSDGQNSGVTAGSYITKHTGSEIFNLFAEDFQVDVTTVARVNGGKCFNTNAAAGTLAQAGLVDCLGTASGSWHLRGSPTLDY
jgi:hypothetical protein